MLSTYLVKCGLGNGVVFYVESLFVLGEDAKYPSQRGWRGWELILQHVAMLLLQHASWKSELEEVLNRG